MLSLMPELLWIISLFLAAVLMWQNSCCCDWNCTMKRFALILDLLSYIARQELLHVMTANYRNWSHDSESVLDTSYQSCLSVILHGDVQYILLGLKVRKMFFPTKQTIRYEISYEILISYFYCYQHQCLQINRILIF